MLKENSLETFANVGVLPPVSAVESGHKISSLVPFYLRHAQYDLGLSPQTVKKYRDSLACAVKDMGDLPVESLDLQHFTILKEKILTRGAGVSRIHSVVFAMRGLLKYCRESMGLKTLDEKKIKPPKRKRRDVIFLTNEEIKQFIDSIKIEKAWECKRRGRFLCLEGLRFRALVEVLLGTGMRISEALQLDRDSIDFDRKEAKIIGKGNKERMVFFSDRSLQWIRYYIEARTDSEKPLFLGNWGTRLKREDISKLFKRYTVKAGISKKITPHILRHTMATNLLFNGCPISHVKEILGHDRLETTCRYYLGVDKRIAKEAHGKYLNF